MYRHALVPSLVKACRLVFMRATYYGGLGMIQVLGGGGGGGGRFLGTFNLMHHLNL